ncbi:hypothetical protein LCGC14_2061460, partial [marine sediment metagenome]
RITDALKLGDLQKRNIEEAELINNFGFSDDEVKGFKNVRRMYDVATQMQIKRRKMVGGYDKLPAAEQQAADKHIAREVQKFAGYVSQSRLGGNWATFIEVNDPKSPLFPYHFNLHPNKSDAVIEAKALGGTSENVYLRNKLKPDIYGRMSITDLESLADSAGVDANSPDLSSLMSEIQKRSYSSHCLSSSY